MGRGLFIIKLRAVSNVGRIVHIIRTMRKCKNEREKFIKYMRQMGFEFLQPVNFYCNSINM